MDNRQDPTITDPVLGVISDCRRHGIFVTRDQIGTILSLISELSPDIREGLISLSRTSVDGQESAEPGNVKNIFDSNSPEGVKFDQEKPRTDLLPIDSMLGVAKVLTHGSKKYNDRNWEKGMNWGRMYGAALRHLFAFWSGEGVNPDTGKDKLHHIDQAACCITMLQHYYHNEQYARFDDRPKGERDEQVSNAEAGHQAESLCYRASAD